MNLAFSELLPPGATPLTSGRVLAAPLSKGVTMRIASFNVENMFRRAVALNFANWKDGKVIREQYGLVNSLLEEPVTVSIKKSIVDTLEKLGLKKRGVALSAAGFGAARTELCSRTFRKLPKQLRPLRITRRSLRTWICKRVGFFRCPRKNPFIHENSRHHWLRRAGINDRF